MFNKLIILSASILVTAAQACPDLSGTYICPPSKYTGATQAYKVKVEKGPHSDTILFSFQNGAPTALIADGNLHSDSSKSRSYSCDSTALLTNYFSDASGTTLVGTSRQQLDANGDYQVVRKDGSIGITCFRVSGL